MRLLLNMMVVEQEKQERKKFKKAKKPRKMEETRRQTRDNRHEEEDSVVCAMVPQSTLHIVDSCWFMVPSFILTTDCRMTASNRNDETDNTLVEFMLLSARN